MNTAMWEHPFTSKQLRVLNEELGFIIVEPVVKKLVCGDLGKGAMAEVSTLVDVTTKTASVLSEALRSTLEGHKAVDHTCQ